MTQKEIADTLYKKHLFFGHMFFLPALGFLAPDEFFEQFLDDEDNDPLLVAAGFEMKYVVEYRNGKMDQTDFTGWNIARSDDYDPQPLDGWFVQVCGPSLRYDVEMVDGVIRQSTYSTGMISWRWFYSATIEGIVEQALAWRDAELKKKWDEQQKVKKPKKKKA
jgi:hypothetical protein